MDTQNKGLKQYFLDCCDYKKTYDKELPFPFYSSIYYWLPCMFTDTDCTQTEHCDGNHQIAYNLKDAIDTLKEIASEYGIALTIKEIKDAFKKNTFEQDVQFMEAHPFKF